MPENLLQLKWGLVASLAGASPGVVRISHLQTDSSPADKTPTSLVTRTPKKRDPKP
ncbi:hypothetical protein GCM10007888_48720 [Methylobacterium oxalidis]|uniref:Uncharacterized protein n=1 Tax=Methylobacterium oxalidis TaxID=944322 RepID=A0ABQ6DQW9_9HYPH|nr:hypothetical protein GCM10007888_48720 [Methylobacterium oxalidis]